MPKIRRWFNVSHDINSDPEVWDLTDRWDSWGLRVWLQILSVADRNEGFVKGDLDLNARSMARLCGSNSKRYNTEWRRNEARMMLDWMLERGWIELRSGSIYVRNYLTYKNSKETKKLLLGTPPNHPNQPTLKDTDEPPPETQFLTVQDLVDSWNEFFQETALPKVEWPLSKSRHAKATLRCKEHKTEEFWTKVFQNIKTSNFLMGKGNGTWKCTLDFLIANDTNLIKIYEGSYNGK